MLQRSYHGQLCQWYVGFRWFNVCGIWNNSKELLWPVDQLYSERTPWKQHDLLLKVNPHMTGLIPSMVKPALCSRIFQWMKKILADALSTFVHFVFSLLRCQEKISDFHQKMENGADIPAIMLLLLFLLLHRKACWFRKERDSYGRLTIFEGNPVICRSGVHFHWTRSVLSIWELLLWGLAPSTHSGSEKTGDLVWPCPESAWESFDSSGIHLRFGHSICVSKDLCLFLAVCPMTSGICQPAWRLF